jgi:hypothetical protein
MDQGIVETPVWGLCAASEHMTVEQKYWIIIRVQNGTLQDSEEGGPLWTAVFVVAVNILNIEIGSKMRLCVVTCTSMTLYTKEKWKLNTYLVVYLKGDAGSTK